MRFYQNDYFWLYLLIPLIFLLILGMGRLRKRNMGRIGIRKTVGKLFDGINRTAVNLSLLLTSLGFILAVAALSRPQYPGGVERVETTGGKIVIALDLSLSMLAEDFQPNRLAKAKREIIDLLDKLKAQSTGLVIFAGEAFVQCPPTVDYSAFRMFLDVAGVGMISDTGTDIADAIEVSVNLLDDDSPVDKAIVIFTDGESFDGDAGKEASKAYKKGIQVYTIGVGSVTGRPIPEAVDGGGSLKKDDEGEIVLSRLNIEELEDIAREGGGKFFRATPGEQEIDEIYADIKGLEGEDKEKKYRTLYDEKYKWLLLPGIIFFAAAIFIPTRRNNGF
ncbi:MAG: VWA domain-containing protein [candidate division Zixibacteria bacterium]